MFNSNHTYVYLKSEPNLWTVGFYDPFGKWHSESDHDKKENAAERAAWLNGCKNNIITENIKKNKPIKMRF